MPKKLETETKQRTPRVPRKKKEVFSDLPGIHERLEEEQFMLTPEDEERARRPMVLIVDAMLATEGVRIATQVRKSHLEKNGRSDPDTDELLRYVGALERFLDDKVENYVLNHPAYPWFSRIKGIGRENIAKVTGLIDIQEDDTVSSLWAFAGYSVKNGKAPRRVRGTKLPYNALLRTMCWRVGGSLMKAKGKYYDYYLEKKLRYTNRFLNEGFTIVPSSELPTDKDGKMYEPPGIVSEGHIHNMALRKMIKLFLSHLWVVWREAEGLSTRSPYVEEHLKHTHITSPQEMLDR